MTKPHDKKIDGSNVKLVDLGNVFRREIFYKSPSEISISFDGEEFIFKSSLDKFIEINKYEVIIFLCNKLSIFYRLTAISLF